MTDEELDQLMTALGVQSNPWCRTAMDAITELRKERDEIHDNAIEEAAKVLDKERGLLDQRQCSRLLNISSWGWPSLR